MAGAVQFDLVSPEKRLASLEAMEVQVPGAEGDFTAMADHVPMMTTLRPGVLTVKSTDGDHDFVVTGGFAEVTATGVTVLAERAVAKADVTAEGFATIVADAKAAASDKDGPALDRANKTLADVQALGTSLGF